MNQLSIGTESKGINGSAWIFVYLKTQFSNAGDALIIREQVRIFRRFGKIHAARSGVPEAFLQELALSSSEVLPGGWLKLVVRAAMHAAKSQEGSYLLLPPGDPGGGVTIGTLSRCFIFPLLSLLGIRIVRVGFSLGRLSPMRMRLESWISRWCYFQGIRDGLSMADAQRYYFKKIGYFPDLSLYMPHASEMRGPEQTRNPRIAISFRGDNLDEQSKKATIDHLFRSIERYRETATLVGIVQVERDQDFVARIVDEARARGFRTDSNLLKSINLKKLAESYSKCDLVVTNRLHVFLFGALNGSMPLAILDRVRNRKITGILETLGLSNFSIEIFSTEGEAIRIDNLEPADVAIAIQKQKDEIEKIIPILASER